MPVRQGDAVTGVALAACEEDIFRELIISEAYDGRGYSFICDGQGRLLVSAESGDFGEGARTDSALRASLLASAEFEDTEARESFAAALAAGQSGMSVYRLADGDRYAAYVPLDINDWRLLNVLPGAVIRAEIDQATRYTLWLVLIVMLYACATFAFLAWRERRSKQEIELERARLRVSENEYRIAATQSGKTIVRYDLKTRTLYLSATEAAALSLPEVAEDVPESVIARGLLAEESVEDYREFFAAMRRGEATGNCTMRYRRSDGFGWYRGEYSLLVDEQAQPLRAVISFVDITEEREKQMAYERWQQTITALAGDNAMFFEHNLTRDVSDWRDGTLFAAIETDDGRSFNERTIYWAHKSVHPDDADRYIAFLNRERLLAAYYDGVHEETLDYRRGSSDKYRWINLSVQMAQYPNSEDIKIIMLFRDVDRQKREELALKARSEEDALTGTLNHKTFAERVDELLQQMPGVQHALVMIDLDEFKEVNDNYGHMVGDRVLVEIAHNLKSLLRSGDLVGRIGGDEFMICLKNIPYHDVIDKRAELICRLLHIEIVPDVFLSGSLGIALYPRDGQSFAALYRNADVAVYHAKSSGRDRVVFYEQGLESDSFTSAATPIDLPVETEAAGEHGELAEILSQNRLLLERQATQEGYQLIMEGLHPVVFEWNARSGVEHSSEGFDQYVLANRPLAEVFRDHADPLAVHPDDRRALRSLLHEQHDQADPRMEVALRLLKTDGSYEWCRLMLRYVFGEDGKLRRAVGAITAIDFVRDTAEIQLSAITSYMQGGVILYEVGHRLRTLYISDSFYRMVGAEAGSFGAEGDDVLALVHPDDRVEFERRLRQAAESGELLDFVYRAQSIGEQGWRHIRAIRIPYAGSSEPVLIATLTDVTALKRHEQKLMLESQQLQYIFDMSGLDTFEVDLEKRKLSLSAALARKYDLDATNEKLSARELVASGIIHDDSAQEFEVMCGDLMSGRREGSCIVKVKKRNGNYTPVKLTYKCLFDDYGQLYRAVGLCEDVESIVDAQFQFEQETKLRSLCTADLLAYARVNLSRDAVETVWLEGMSPVELSAFQSYASFYETTIARIPNSEERRTVADRLHSDDLKQVYSDGEKWVRCEFRYQDSQGRLIWVLHITRLLTDPASGDLYAFIYLRNIDRKKKWERALPMRVEREAVSGLYDDATLRALAVQVLTEKPAEDCTVALLEIERFRELTAQFGSATMHNIRLSVARKLRMSIHSDHLIGYLGDGRFAIFFSGGLTDAEIMQVMLDILKTMKVPALFASYEELYLRLHVGLSARGGNYGRLYNEALSALHSLRGQQEEELRCFEPAADAAPAAPSLLEYRPLVAAAETGIAAEQKESEAVPALLACVRLMQDAADPDAAMEVVLGHLGRYFGARRAVIHELDADSGCLNERFVWYPEGMKPGFAPLRGVEVARSAALQRSIETRRLLIVHDIGALKESFPALYEDYRRCGLQRFVLAPFGPPERVCGFLGLSDPSRREEDMALIETLAVFVGSELQKRRLLDRQQWLLGHDELSGLPNRESFLQFCQSLDPEVFSSLGAAVVDINDLDGVNRTYGVGRGDELIVLAADTLRKGFAAGEVYRMGGSTFYVLAADVSYRHFTDRIRAAEDALANRHPGRFAFGHTWTDAGGDPQSRLHHAIELMRASKREQADRRQGGRDLQNTQSHELEQALAEGWFEVFLQPKMNIAGGSLCGAEALVRMRHPQHGLLPPMRFIPPLEELGSVRRIDLFVFEQVCALLVRWQREGRPRLPVSLNFSRLTVLEPGIVDTIEALADRYGVDKSLLEIEITETLGDLEHETILSIGNAILTAGFRLALDDFGAKYSNLSILSSIRFSSLKVDKSLTDHIVANEMSQALVKHVVQICDQFGIESLAEGVETEEQLARLREYGCDSAQGYLFNKPIPIADFEQTYFPPPPPDNE